MFFIYLFIIFILRKCFSIYVPQKEKICKTCMSSKSKKNVVFNDPVTGTVQFKKLTVLQNLKRASKKTQT